MSEPTSFTLGRLVRYAVQAVVLGFVMVSLILASTVDHDTWRHLRGFPPGLLGVILLMVCTAWVCIGTRIWLIARSMGYRLRYRDGLATGLSSEFGVAASPAGIGGAAVRVAYLHRAGIPLEASLTVFAADSVLDIIFFLLLAPVTAAVAWCDPGWREILGSLAAPCASALGLIGLALVAVGVGLRYHRRLGRHAERLSGRFRHGRLWRLPGRLRHLRNLARRSLQRTWLGAGFLLHCRRTTLLAGLGLAGVQWICRYGVLPVLLLAFPVERNPFPLLLVQGLFFALALVMVLPGGGGGIELLCTALLRLFLPLSLVGVVVLMWRVFTYHLYLLAGGIAFSLTYHRRFPLRICRRSQDEWDRHCSRAP